MVILFSFSIVNVRSQPVDSHFRLLSVEMTRNVKKVFYIFKPGTKLKIETIDSIKLSITDYSLFDNAIIISQLDTVYFSEIVRIKGKVLGNEGRKILGGAISFISIPAALMGGMIAQLASLPGVIGGIPFTGSFIGGISLMGPRKFNTSDRWTLLLRPE